MILSQLMTAFPGTATVIEPDVPDAWYVGTVLGPLQPGMTEWFDKHDLIAHASARRVPAYELRWKVNPDRQRIAVDTVLTFAKRTLTRIPERDGIHPRRLIAYVEDATKEMRL